MNILVTWMYSSPVGESINHAQTGPNSSSQEVKDYYWRCVFLLFESSKRLNSCTRHILFLNELPPDEIDGVETLQLLRQYEVEIVEFDHITISPQGYYEAWNTQFIIIDILEQLLTIVSDEDIVLILDSDVVFNKPISAEFETCVKEMRTLIYTIRYNCESKINGLNRSELLQISREINNGFPADEFVYSGGEFFCCLGSEVGKIAKLARETYRQSLVRYGHGLKKFNEEAHLLSYVYHVIGYKSGTANRYIKRIWTNRDVYTNVDGSENQLILWHLPAEKRRGFADVFSTYKVRNGIYSIITKDLMRKYRIEEPRTEKIQRISKKVRLKLMGLLNAK